MTKISSKYRTHHAGELNKTHAGEKVTLSGWIQRKRDHGGVIFVDLRDHYGVTQVVFNDEVAEKIDPVRLESVIEVTGIVRERGEGLVNPNISTGEIEVPVDELVVHSEADVLPFQVAEDDNAPESIRLRSRFLELRREKLHRNIVIRSKVIAKIREEMEKQGFLEVQTPILTASSPEGARDFIVPSRLHPGKFYALPQAPQQFKQLLMVGGFDRYFQIAPCFRDEDARADRSPTDFYQLDMELSFVEREDIFRINEAVIKAVFDKFSDWGVPSEFVKIPFAQAMSDYGTDKPDLRNPLKIKAITSVFADTEFKVFQSIIADGGEVFAIKVSGQEAPSRKYFDDLIKDFTKASGGGLGNLIFEDEIRGSFKKLVSDAEIAALKTELEIEAGDIVLIAAGVPAKILPHMGRLRDQLGQDFNLINKEEWQFCWITDFPFYEEDPETGKIDFSHNPFSMPQGGLDALNNEDPLTIKAFQYDLVLNGYELASGGIRNHSPEIMFKAFEIAGYGPEVVEEKFGGLLRAFHYGAPPHGGIAHGIERIVMLLCGEEAIRDVMAFPTAQNGEDLLMGSPSTVSDVQLKEVHIKVEMPKKGLDSLQENSSKDNNALRA